MTYKEFLGNRTYPVYSFCVVNEIGNYLADSNDMKTDKLGDKQIVDIVYQLKYVKTYETLVPCKIVVLKNC